MATGISKGDKVRVREFEGVVEYVAEYENRVNVAMEGSDIHFCAPLDRVERIIPEPPTKGSVVRIDGVTWLRGGLGDFYEVEASGFYGRTADWKDIYKPGFKLATFQ